MADYPYDDPSRYSPVFIDQVCNFLPGDLIGGAGTAAGIVTGIQKIYAATYRHPDYVLSWIAFDDNYELGIEGNRDWHVRGDYLIERRRAIYVIEEEPV